MPPALGMDPRRLAALIRERELTQWFSVPSVLTYLVKFGAIAPGDFPKLERLLWCGEVLPTPVLAELMELLPHVRFTNLYGPTETTIASSYHTVPERLDTTRTVPIGVPCAGEELLVLDDRQRAVPAGQTGELFIAGAGLSPGYWRDEDKTREAFLPDPRAPGSGGRAGPGGRAGSGGASIARATSRGDATTACSSSSGAPTRRSRAAATASSWARSRWRWGRSRGCGSAPS